MARVAFTAAADADAAFIFDDLYTKAGKSTVIKYRAALKTLYEHLAEFPESGAPRPKIGPKIRIGIVHPYIVQTVRKLCAIGANSPAGAWAVRFERDFRISALRGRLSRLERLLEASGGARRAAMAPLRRRARLSSPRRPRC
jgi:plasmid stabilization system protein ParE